MKVGDIVKVSPCFEGKLHCDCFFCYGDSNRVGLVIADDRMTPAEDGYRFGWQVQFDCGEWEVFPADVDCGDVKVISESR